LKPLIFFLRPFPRIVSQFLPVRSLEESSLGESHWFKGLEIPSEMAQWNHQMVKPAVSFLVSTLKSERAAENHPPPGESLEYERHTTHTHTRTHTHTEIEKTRGGRSTLQETGYMKRT